MDILKEFLFIIFVGTACAFSLSFLGNKISEEQNRFSKMEFEVVGYVQTSDRYGRPNFYKILKFADGIERRFSISAEEYFENKE